MLISAFLGFPVSGSIGAVQPSFRSWAQIFCSGFPKGSAPAASGSSRARASDAANGILLKLMYMARYLRPRMRARSPGGDTAASTCMATPGGVPRRGGTRRSQLLAEDEEARPLRDLLVQLDRLHVGLMSLPVHARASGLARPLVDRLDQGAADSLAARPLLREQVLQV